MTEAEHLGTWFSDAGATVDLRSGGEVVQTWTDHGTYTSIIQKVEPQTYLSMIGPGPVGRRPSEGDTTLVEFFLTPKDNGTVLRVVESGFAKLAVSDEEKRKHLEGNTEGWKLELGELREYLER